MDPRTWNLLVNDVVDNVNDVVDNVEDDNVIIYSITEYGDFYKEHLISSTSTWFKMFHFVH